MADANKLVTLIALVIVGLIVAIWGVIYMWLHRNDRLILEELIARGEITAADAARLSNQTWWWVLSIVQVIIGVGLIIWGIFQYFTSVEHVVAQVKEYVPAFGSGSVPIQRTTTTTIPASAPQVIGGTSRRMMSNNAF